MDYVRAMPAPRTLASLTFGPFGRRRLQLHQRRRRACASGLDLIGRVFRLPHQLRKLCWRAGLSLRSRPTRLADFACGCVNYRGLHPAQGLNGLRATGLVSRPLHELRRMMDCLVHGPGGQGSKGRMGAGTHVKMSPAPYGAAPVGRDVPLMARRPGRR